AQVDRFMLKLVVDYPSKEEERRILDRMAATSPQLDIDAVMSPDEILKSRGVVDEIYIDDKIKDYIVDLTFATRAPEAFDLPIADWIQYGASPRATLALTVGAKASAFLSGRGYVTPQDVKTIAMDVLRHRIIITYEAEAEEKTSEDVVRTVLDHIPVP
ncbi:MAG: MoxR family ATPase, partial [Phycisphaerales bacterium]